VDRHSSLTTIELMVHLQSRLPQMEYLLEQNIYLCNKQSTSEYKGKLLC